jgi:hypothetical protein
MAHAPQRGGAYQPKVQPWEQRPTRPRVLKERRISVKAARMSDPSLCGVPSERIPVSGPFPGLHPSLVCVAPLGRERKGPAKIEPDARVQTY